MNTPLHTYEPINQSFTLIWVALAIAVVGAVAAIWLFRQDLRQRGSQYTGLLGMLVGFVALIALGTALFGWLSTTKTGTVRIFSDRIEFGKQTLAFRDLDNAVIEVSRETSWITPNVTKSSVRLLFVSDRQGRTYVMSEKNYPINQIMASLRAAKTSWEAGSPDSKQ